MNMKYLIAAVSGLGLAATTQFAAAKGFDYSYADAGIMVFEADKYDGWGAGANISYGATDLIFLKMGFMRTDIDTDAGPGVDADRFHIGIGAHMEIADDIDALGAVSYIDHEYSGGIPTEADEGYQVDLGLRAMVSKEVELNGNVSFRHMNYTSVLGVSDDEEIGVDVGTVIKIKRRIFFTGKVNYMNESEEAGVFGGIRFTF